MTLEKNILNQTALYVATKNRHLKYTYCNENFAKGLGLDSPTQIIGKSDYDLFDAAIAKFYQHGDSITLNGNRYFNQPEIHPQIDKTIDVLVTKNILMNHYSNDAGIILTFMDITGCSFNKLPSSFSFDEKLLQYKFTIEKQTEYFTRREFSVFRYLMLGYSARLIALRLNLSTRTTEGYIAQIRQKLQCSSKQQVIETAMRYGLGHF